MEEFKSRFIEDANEQLVLLQKALLKLEKEHNSELVQEIFRSLHNLKGASKMYGFERIEEATHEIETIYDRIRTSGEKVADNLITITLELVDYIHHLLRNDNIDKIEEDFRNLLEKIKQFSINSLEKNSDENNRIVGEEDTSATYRIIFHPEATITSRGINIQALLSEIEQFGKCFTTPHTYNTNGNEKVEMHYLLWETFVSTTLPISFLADVFVFVEDEVVIEKIAETNLFDNPDFLTAIEQKADLDEIYSKEELKTLINNILTKKTKNNNETPPPIELSAEEVIDNSNNKVKKYTEHSIKVDSKILDEITNLVGELVTKHSTLALLTEQINISELTTVSEDIEKITRMLRDSTLSLRLLPLDNLLVPLQRMVRDLASSLNKKINFVAVDNGAKLDKNIIDNLINPLMHLFRNCIDHGIESPQERIEKGKPETGLLELQSYYSGNEVHIRISDDGRGINLNKVREKALKMNLISEKNSYTKKQLLDLIFIPGFSTSGNVTELSGRGVGMDVVNKQISQMHGEVLVETFDDKGTIFTVRLPQSISIIDTLLLRLDETYYLVPLSVVHNCFDALSEELFKTQNNRIYFNEQIIPFLYLRDIFGINSQKDNNIERVVVVNYSNQKVGIVVDEIIGQHQAVLKPLGEIFRNQDFLSGASILGSGNVALVLDVMKLIKLIDATS